MPEDDPIIARIRDAFTTSGLTLDELGTKMGYEGDVARKSAWQFLNKTADPRLSMVRRFAEAVGVPVAELLNEQKKGKKMTPLGIPTSLKNMRESIKTKTTAWPQMAKRRDVGNLTDRLDSISESCGELRKCYPEQLYPESKKIGMIHDEILKCQKLPIGSESEKDAFIQKATAAVDSLRSKLDELTGN